jgi:8-amino-7-oxononanoate synthase
MDKWERINSELLQLKNGSLFRKMTVFDSAQMAVVTVEGKKQHLFSSNSYLDLSSEPRIKEYAGRILNEYGAGSGGSRLTTGTTRIHMELEQAIAAFKNSEAALVFNTGYMTNVGILSALTQKGDIIYSDQLNHASIIDGCRLSKADLVVYRHNDMDDLEEKIKAHPEKRGIIVSDGVFSMDGDIVNLPRLTELAGRYGLLSMIDEAHATGVIGATGRGTEEYYGMEGSVDVLMGTLSKAVGGEGGFVCGSRSLIEYLVNKARSFIFSTALSPVSMAADLEGLRLIMEQPERVQKLQENIRFCCAALNARGIDAASETAIIPIIIGGEARAMRVMELLKERGYYISAIRYPTVAKGSARLRLALMSSHTREDLEGLADALKESMELSENE